MNELLRTRLFGLLAEPSQVTNEEMQNAYESFMEQLVIVSQCEQDFSKVFRMLNLSRIEFDSVGSSSLYGQGKKCPEIYLSPKSISHC